MLLVEARNVVLERIVPLFHWHFLIGRLQTEQGILTLRLVNLALATGHVVCSAVFIAARREVVGALEMHLAFEVLVVHELPLVEIRDSAVPPVYFPAYFLNFVLVAGEFTTFKLLLAAQQKAKKHKDFHLVVKPLLEFELAHPLHVAKRNFSGHLAGDPGVSERICHDVPLMRLQCNQLAEQTLRQLTHRGIRPHHF